MEVVGSYLVGYENHYFAPNMSSQNIKIDSKAWRSNISALVEWLEYYIPVREGPGSKPARVKL